MTLLINPYRFAAPTPLTFRELVAIGGPTSTWRVDETSGTTASDSAGSNTGTYSADASTMTATSLLDSAVGTAATNFGLVTIPNDSTLQFFDQEFTIELLFSLPSYVNNQPIVYKWSGASSTLQTWAIFQPPGGKIQFIFRDFTTGSTHSISTNAIVSLSTSHILHVLRDKTANEYRLYLDGVQQTDKFSSGVDMQVTTTDVTLGDSADVSLAFNGTLDEVSIYKSIVLSNSHITDVANAALGL